jgi:hypothetical protein
MRNDKCEDGIIIFMHKIFLLSIFLVLSVFVPPALAPQDRWVLLPTEKALLVTKPCSRTSPANIDGVWIVPAEIVTRLERDLPTLWISMNVSTLHVANPGSYFRQYAGITILGRKFIYINAAKSIDNRSEWKNGKSTVCDGGGDYWGVLYDPLIGEFSQLAFDGEL